MTLGRLAEREAVGELRVRITERRRDQVPSSPYQGSKDSGEKGPQGLAVCTALRDGERSYPSGLRGRTT